MLTSWALISGEQVVKYNGFLTTTGAVTLTSTSSPGTTILSSSIFSNLNALRVIVIASVTLNNTGSSSVTETVQAFMDNNYVNLAQVTVPAGGYVQAEVVYSFTVTPGGHTIGIAAYGGTVQAVYAQMLLLSVEKTQ